MLEVSESTTSTQIANAEVSRFAGLDYVYLGAAAAIWGASFFFTAVALTSFAPGLVTFLRVLFGAITTWLLTAKGVRLRRQDLRKTALLGLVWVAIPLTLFAQAQVWIDSSIAGMLDAGTLITTVIFGVAFFGSKVTRLQLVGTAIGLFGLFIISAPQLTTSGTTTLGVVMALTAVAGYGLSGHLAAPLLQEYGTIAVMRSILAAAVVLTFPFGLYSVAQSTFAWNSLVACVALGVGGTGIAYLFSSELTRRVGAVRASVVTYLIPLVSIFLGVTFLQETVSTWSIVGTATVLLGAFLTTKPRR